MARAGGKQPERLEDAVALAEKTIIEALGVKVLALDYGAARTGVAISDATGTLARPLTVVERAAGEAGLRRLAELVAAEGAERIVVGLPLTLRASRARRRTRRRSSSTRSGRPSTFRSRSFDERFTTTLAAAGPSSRAPEDARAAAHLLESYLTWTSRHNAGDAAPPGRPERRPPRGQLARRASAPLSCWAFSPSRSTSSSAAWRDARRATPPPRRPPPKPVILKIVFPEGFTRKEMVKRVAEVRQIAKTKRKVTPKLSGNAYAAASKAAKVPRLPQARPRDRGLSLSGDVRVHAEDDGEAARRRPDRALQRQLGARSTSATRRRRS